MVQDILNAHKVSVTHARLTILEIFVKWKYALPYADIDKLTGGKLDRITVYRTFQTFLDNGIIHVVPTKDDRILYTLTRGKDSKHVHFICVKCKKAYCLEGVRLPTVKLPVGYSGEGSDCVIYGTCEKCK